MVGVAAGPSRCGFGGGVEPAAGRADPVRRAARAGGGAGRGDGDRPHTLSSRINLAYAHQFAGAFERAIPLFQRALAEHRRVLGPEHHDTLAARAGLARGLHRVGDVTQAINLFERTLADVERVYGADHPFVRMVQEALDDARAESR